jgi:(p)ppGpp synthase/HD superfamily hydrolase
MEPIPADPSRFESALGFVVRLHAKQTRKGAGVPYIAHLMSVSALVLENGGSEDQAIAGLLHDAVEDQGDRYPGGRQALRDTIRERFGETVLAIVNDCTDDDGFQKGSAGNALAEEEQWRLRKQAYIDHLSQAGPASALVSCADKLHNARAILTDYRALGEALWPRFRARTRENQLWYYSTLAQVFREKLPGALADELTRTVAELETISVSAGAIAQA